MTMPIIVFPSENRARHARHDVRRGEHRPRAPEHALRALPHQAEGEGLDEDALPDLRGLHLLLRPLGPRHGVQPHAALLEPARGKTLHQN